MGKNVTNDELLPFVYLCLIVEVQIRCCSAQLTLGVYMTKFPLYLFFSLVRKNSIVS
jgi:hypothetical protein